MVESLVVSESSLDGHTSIDVSGKIIVSFELLFLGNKKFRRFLCLFINAN